MFRFLAKRVPVVYQNTPLMSMRWGRAKEKVRLGKARFRLHRSLGIKYLELLEKPSGFNTQKVVLGFDPGSHYDGFSVVSNQCHHDNVELIHHKCIKDRMKKRSMYRRIRRGRILNREAKFNSKTRSIMPPTLKSIYDYRVWLVDQISKLYPISDIVYERPRFNTWKKKFFGFATLVMQGLNKLVKYLESKNIVVIEKSGYETKNKRIDIFGEDYKVNSKNDKSFFAHCIDSYTLSTMVLDEIPSTNTKTRFITKNWNNRRELYKWKNKIGDRRFYKKIYKNGEVELLDPWYGNKNPVCKVRVAKYPKSFSIMTTKEVPRKPKYKQFVTRYGGTVWYGISKLAKYVRIDGNKLPEFGRDHLRCKWISENLDKVRLVGYTHRCIEVVN